MGTTGNAKDIVVTGNTVDGFQFFGPFLDSDAAVSWAEKNCQGEDWLLADLEEPDDAGDDDDVH